MNGKGTREAIIRVFDIETGKERQRWPMGHGNVYFSLAVSPDGKVLGCGSSERSCLLDLTTGQGTEHSDRPAMGPWVLA